MFPDYAYNRGVFSDRLRGVKILLAAAAFAGLCWASEVQVRRHDPPVETLPLNAEVLLGREIKVSAKTVSAAHPDWVELRTASGPIRVLGRCSPPARVGDVLSAVGVATGPREIRASRLRVHEGFGWKRPLNYGVSALTLFLFALWAAPFLRGRLRDGLLRSRY